ncbi:MAG: SUMF1/EgtB/PvdO family nonheme iron enzyme [Roseiarcus sp.]|jgi:formylglycine-generating enzyme required for sulfatase activity
MSRIFLSHSSKDDFEAIAIRDWLAAQGWDDVFLDLDPVRGIAAGERWERALNEAAMRCEAVLFVVSRDWLASGWCLEEFRLADKLNKRMFGLLIDGLAIADLPPEIARDWQLVDLASGRDHAAFRAVTPDGGKERHVTFSQSGLARLKAGLNRAGLDPKYFAWPPESDPDRPPYRGLKALEAGDAGIFFGREAPTIAALDRLRGLREAAPPRFLAILGASGAGKSSFLRAGILPRLARDDRHFLTLPVVRPERSAIGGESGLLRALDLAFANARLGVTRAQVQAAIGAGAAALSPLLARLAQSQRPAAQPGEPQPEAPTLALAVDQGEELFLAEGAAQARAFLTLLKDLANAPTPALIAMVAIRSDAYERLQSAPELEGVRQETFSLSPLPRGSYESVIEGPARRLGQSGRPLTIEPALTQALLADIETGGAKDALPLLAFTLERLYVDHGGDGDLTLAEYRQTGGVKGSIEAAVERAMAAADSDPKVPRDRAARLALLRRALIPWLAGIDPETGAPRRRIARMAEIPEEARPLVEHLVAARLLATDVAENGAVTIEPAHEALLRQWGLLQGWLEQDFGLLTALEGVKRATRDWAANAKSAAWLNHGGGRLEDAERLKARADLAPLIGAVEREYLAACRAKEQAARKRARRVQAVIYALLVGVIAGLVGWINQEAIKEQVNWWMTMRPYMLSQVRPYVLSAAAEAALNPGATFRECATVCPEMIVIPAGAFTMGSPTSEPDRKADEGPQRQVVIAKPFAVSIYDVTFDDWDACVKVGGCPDYSDGGMGRGRKPMVHVTWDDAQNYVAWFSLMTGAPYRLLSEAEWEYAARAGTTTPYYWGAEIGKGNANCVTCGSAWDDQQTSPVGSFAANKFGLYDMAGDAWQWTQDCYRADYNGAPADGSAWTNEPCWDRVARGGAYEARYVFLRSATRLRIDGGDRDSDVGFRIARTLAR